MKALNGMNCRNYGKLPCFHAGKISMADLFDLGDTENSRIDEKRDKRRVPRWVISDRPRPLIENKARFDLGSSWNDLRKLFGR